MLKGTTRIELKNVHTGAVEVVEKENMVTKALQYFFNPMGYIKSADPMVTSEYVEYIGTLTGGLLLLNKTLREDVENITLPGDVVQTGCAVYGQQNTSDQVCRGNYNATESELDIQNRRVKYVYDFDTAEGNGTIASVALTNALGGYTNRGLINEPVRGKYPFYKNVGSGLLNLTGSDSSISAYDRTMDYLTYGTGYKWIIKIDGTSDTVYYFSVSSTTSITIHRYRANINTISLFDRPAARRTLKDTTEVNFTKAINQQYFSYNYDEENDKLYIVSGGARYLSSNAAFMVTVIDMANGYAVKQYEMTNKTGTNMKLSDNRDSIICYDGYLYFQNGGYPSVYNFYRQEIGNSANIQKLDVGVRSARAVMARDGLVYFEMASSYSGSQCLYIIDTRTFTFTLPESITLYDYSARQFVPVIGYPLMYYMSNGTYGGTFGIRTDYLATINNLATPVVKTADKTMKVTYILQEQ